MAFFRTSWFQRSCSSFWARLMEWSGMGNGPAISGGCRPTLGAKEGVLNHEYPHSPPLLQAAPYPQQLLTEGNCFMHLLTLSLVPQEQRADL